MVEKLRGKPGGAEIPVEMGNFANLKIGGRFSLIYVVFNTFFGILTQEDQVRCFSRVAKRLAPDGAFVIEAFVPDLTRFDHGQRTSTTLLSDERTVMEVSKLDAASQRVRSQHLVIDDGGIHRYPVELRFAYPPELDLMARIAGMRLRALGRLGSASVHIGKREPYFGLRAGAAADRDVDQKCEAAAFESRARTEAPQYVMRSHA